MTSARDLGHDRNNVSVSEPEQKVSEASGLFHFSRASVLCLEHLESVLGLEIIDDGPTWNDSFLICPADVVRERVRVRKLARMRQILGDWFGREGERESKSEKETDITQEHVH